MEKVKPINNWEGSSRLENFQIDKFYQDHLSWIQSDWNYNSIPVQNKYWIQCEAIENSDDVSNSVKCSVYSIGKYSGEMLLDGDVKIGEYERNYHSFAAETFHPFHKDGQDYALYSPDYRTTRVMKLPSCEDIGGEDLESPGFCPMEYFVPCKEMGKNEYSSFSSNFGFVAGCVWGDDSSRKIQYLDLSEVGNGNIERKPQKLGYHEIPDKISLEDAVDLRWYSEDEELDIDNHISIATFRLFDVDEERNFHIQHDGISKKQK